MFLFLAGLTFSILEVQPRRFPDAAALVVINSPSDWEGFAVETPPRVDFAKQSVVAVFGGERPTGGWSVRVRSIEQRGSSCTVRYEVVGPPPGAVVTQAITHPFAVVKVDAKCESVSEGK
jgi:hypothetical protein